MYEDLCRKSKELYFSCSAPATRGSGKIVQVHQHPMIARDPNSNCFRLEVHALGGWLTTILCSFRPIIDVRAAAFRCHPCLSNRMSKASVETAVHTKMTATQPSSSYQWLHLCYYRFVALLANFILKAIRLHIGSLAWPEYPNLAPMQR